MSMSICRAQSDSMQENPMLVALGKRDGKGGGGECDNKGSKTGGRERGAEDEEITKLKKKKKDVSCRRKEAMSFAW